MEAHTTSPAFAANGAEVLSFANDTELGLSNAIITGNEQKRLRFAQGTEAVWRNLATLPARTVMASRQANDQP